MDYLIEIKIFRILTRKKSLKKMFKYKIDEISTETKIFPSFLSSSQFFLQLSRTSS